MCIQVLVNPAPNSSNIAHFRPFELAEVGISSEYMPTRGQGTRMSAKVMDGMQSPVKGTHATMLVLQCFPQRSYSHPRGRERIQSVAQGSTHPNSCQVSSEETDIWCWQPRTKAARVEQTVCCKLGLLKPMHQPRSWYVVYLWTQPQTSHNRISTFLTRLLSLMLNMSSRQPVARGGWAEGV